MDLDMKEIRKRHEELRKYKLEKEKESKKLCEYNRKNNIYEALKDDGVSYRDLDGVVDDIERIWDED